MNWLSSVRYPPIGAILRSVAQDVDGCRERMFWSTAITTAKGATALQTARERALTCTAIGVLIGFGTYSAHKAPAWAACKACQLATHSLEGRFTQGVNLHMSRWAVVRATPG
jgi:hypothetical protein